MRLTQLRDFLEVVDSGGVRAAARRLGVSQPALTKSLHQLESELGVTLLERSTRGVVLAPAGRAFAIRARAIQAELACAQEEMAAHAANGRMSVSLGMAPLAALLLFPRALTRFQVGYPDTRVRVVEGAPGVLLPMLRERSLDLVVTKQAVDPGDSSLQARVLVRAPLVIGARRGHPLGATTDLARLVDTPWLVFSPLGEPGTVFNEMFERAGLPAPRPAIQTESYATALAVLAHTDTIGILSPGLLSERWAGGVLREVPVAQAVPSITLSLYLRKESTAGDASAAMARALAAVAREVAAADRAHAASRTT